MLQETETPKKTSCIFSKETYSSILGSGNPKNMFYISGNGTFRGKETELCVIYIPVKNLWQMAYLAICLATTVYRNGTFRRKETELCLIYIPVKNLWQTSYIFSKDTYSYISGNGNPENMFCISDNGTFCTQKPEKRDS